MNKKEDSQNLLKRFAIYGGIFLVAIFIIIFNRTFDNKEPQDNNQKTSEIEENETLKALSKINDKFFSMNIHLILDDDAITLEYQKVDTIEVGMKKYHNEEIEYIKTENDYYTLENNNFVKNNEFTNFNFDKTFINLNNIKELLSSKGEYTKSKINEYNVIEYTYSLKDIIKIYNNYNDKSIIVTGKGQITLTAYYKEDKLEYFEIDTTDLYNLIENRNLNQVKYIIELQEEKEDDPSWILEKLS